MKYLFNTLLIIFVWMSMISAQKDGFQDTRGFIVEPGDMAPEMTLILTSGDTLDIVSLRGKAVVLQFTASWCSVCRKEMPHLEKEVWLPNKDKDFILIGIDYDEPMDKVNEFVKQMNITYPMAIDPGGSHFSQFAHPKSGVTRNVVIDKKGKIVFLTRLYDQAEFDEMKRVINELLNAS